jgi:acylphosphatase
VRVRATALFHGRVQGVYFRAHCEEKALSLGLEGYVSNLPDGSVGAVFEGERALVEECIEWNRTSQPAARVTSVDITWAEATGEFRGFSVRRR